MSVPMILSRPSNAKNDQCIVEEIREGRTIREVGLRDKRSSSRSRPDSTSAAREPFGNSTASPDSMWAESTYFRNSIASSGSEWSQEIDGFIQTGALGSLETDPVRLLKRNFTPDIHRFPSHHLPRSRSIVAAQAVRG